MYHYTVTYSLQLSIHGFVTPLEAAWQILPEAEEKKINAWWLYLSIDPSMSLRYKKLYKSEYGTEETMDSKFDREGYYIQASVQCFPLSHKITEYASVSVAWRRRRRDGNKGGGGGGALTDSLPRAKFGLVFSWKYLSSV